MINSLMTVIKVRKKTVLCQIWTELHLLNFTRTFRDKNKCQWWKEWKKTHLWVIIQNINLPFLKQDKIEYKRKKLEVVPCCWPCVSKMRSSSAVTIDVFSFGRKWFLAEYFLQGISAAHFSGASFPRPSDLKRSIGSRFYPRLVNDPVRKCSWIDCVRSVTKTF